MGKLKIPFLTSLILLVIVAFLWAAGSSYTNTRVSKWGISESNLDGVAISGTSTIDDTIIGGTTPAAGTFTTLTTTGKLTITQAVLSVLDSDTDLAILTTSSGKAITNYGATGSRTFTLPTAAAGMVLDILHADTDNLKVVKSGSDTILGTTNNSLVISAGTLGGSLRLVATRALQWVITGREDTWTDTTVLP